MPLCGCVWVCVCWGGGGGAYVLRIVFTDKILRFTNTLIINIIIIIKRHQASTRMESTTLQWERGQLYRHGQKRHGEDRLR